MPIDVNKADVSTLSNELDIAPSIAKRIIERRAAKPFAAPEELLEIEGIGNVTYERIAPLVATGTSNVAGELPDRFSRQVARFANLMTSLSRPPSAAEEMRASINQMELIINGLLADPRDRTDSAASGLASQVMDALDDDLDQLEMAVLALLASVAQPVMPQRGFYEQFLMADISDRSVASIAFSSSPVLTLNNTLIASPLGVGVFAALSAKDRLKQLTTLIGKNKTKINAVLKLLSKLGGKAALLKYLASVLEALDDSELIKINPPPAPGAGGATESCYADVFLTALAYDGSDVGNDLILKFNIRGVEKQQTLTFNKGDTLSAPILLHSFATGGICGQVTGNDVNITFQAIEDDAFDDMGSSSTYTFNRACPSTEPREMLSLVREGSVSATITATVEVVKQCGASDQISV